MRKLLKDTRLERGQETHVEFATFFYLYQNNFIKMYHLVTIEFVLLNTIFTN